ncbi:MAG: hypothetical protein BGO30_04755 [Bacteroidetes bacterium 41-46]|nr:MAG: hypothetical protein BGO30_04755 [Bacteroidetes bacterium 41-46]
MIEFSGANVGKEVMIYNKNLRNFNQLIQLLKMRVQWKCGFCQIWPPDKNPLAQSKSVKHLIIFDL